MNVTYDQDQFERFAKKFDSPVWGKKRNSSYFYLTDKNEQVTIDPLIKKLGPPVTILDYGCGQYGQALDLIKSIYPATYTYNYDPFVNEFKQEPQGQFELVVCFNVLNAVRAVYIQPVIDDLYNLSTKYVMLNVILFEQEQYAGDCRKKEWYLEQLAPYFTVQFESVSGLIPSIVTERGLTRKVFWLLEKKDLVPQPGVEPG